MDIYEDFAFLLVFIDYTKAVFLSTAVLPAPMPMAKIADPIKHNTRWIIPAFKGVIMGIIVKKSIPIPKHKRIDNQVFCFAITQARIYTAEKSKVRKAFDKMHIARLYPETPPSRVKGSFAMAPPIIPPRKNTIIIPAPETKQTRVFDKT